MMKYLWFRGWQKTDTNTLYGGSRLAKGIVNADSVIVLSHFKGHEMGGFGGAIKNLAMGGAPAVGNINLIIQ